MAVFGGKAPIWLITFCHKYPPAVLIGNGVLHFLPITAGWMLRVIISPPVLVAAVLGKAPSPDQKLHLIPAGMRMRKCEGKEKLSQLHDI